MTTWDDLNARSRGLSRHLLGRRQLERLALAPDPASLGRDLRALGFPVPEDSVADPAAVELAVRRRAAASLATLERWAAHRRDMLAIVFEDEERRSIVGLLRGSVQHAPPAQRLAGLLPTPNLPERALEELSRQPSPAQIATLLQVWRHPLAGALLPAAASAEPDLLHLEVLVHRAFAARALASLHDITRRGPLLRHVRQWLDLENCLTVLSLAGDDDARIAGFWLAGGSSLELALAERAVAAGSAPAAGRILAQAFPGSPIGAVLRDPARHDAGIEVALLRARALELQAKARLNPLSPAPFLSFALRLRAEVLDLGRIIWGLALGAPRALLTANLATVP